MRCHWDERIWKQFVLFHRLDFFSGESGLDNKRISVFYAESDNNSVALLDQKAESRGLRSLLGGEFQPLGVCCQRQPDHPRTGGTRIYV